MSIKNIILFAIILYLSGVQTIAQSKVEDNEKLMRLVEELKEDPRGPYKDIRWFCADGSINEPKVPCNQEGSFQHARYKDIVQSLASQNHIFLGQILTGTNHEDFWDQQNFHDRYKQYQLEKYLKAIDNGWINRKAQFYRGAVQVEDEMKWGKDFLLSILSDDKNLEEKYFIVRQAVMNIPHSEDDNVKQQVRAISKIISDDDSRFMPLRIKIHGNPDKSDIIATDDFLKKTTNIKPRVKVQLEELSHLMTEMYAPIDLDNKIFETNKLSNSIKVKDQLVEAFKRLKSQRLSYESLVVISDALVEIRKNITISKIPSQRLRLFDLSIDLETILLNQISELALPVLGDLNGEICYLTGVVYGGGYIETWEWDYLEGQLSSCQFDQFELYDIINFYQNAKNSIEWSTNMVRAYYNPTINKMGQFETLSYGLIDEIVRSSPLLFLGQRVSLLGDWLNKELKFANSVIGINQSNQIRGLNAGYAKGKLEIVSGDVENLTIDKSKIYIFDQPPSDLKPIAGIATVSEGNPVSHIQLLARNLGIPNSVISIDDFNKLKAFQDQEVFYAVSAKGTVILKKSQDMSKEEMNLFSTQTRSEEKIMVPTDRLALDNANILNLRNLDKDDSGIYCGPKAANLGELKKLFPEMVVEGLVIPFGVFRKHMDQRLPNNASSYWDFVNETFDVAKEMSIKGRDEDEIELYQLSRLKELREYIKSMPLLEDFEDNLEGSFKSTLKGNIGKVPVFLRSDTNMEDLKDFTGAGLNLTLFNVLDTKAIIQGIKDVWASPYNERSFKWRQKFLLNPENVYPSILIIPSVNVDHSGVLITKGLKTNSYNDLTVAFNRGVGGAVDGQAAESYTLLHSGINQLDAPSREIKLRYLPLTGGTAEAYTHFSNRILSDENIKEIRKLARAAEAKIIFSENENQNIAHDIEFGFLEDQMWLFQVRPFVENKNALGSEYLNSIAPLMPKNKYINYKTNVN